MSNCHILKDRSEIYTFYPQHRSRNEALTMYTSWTLKMVPLPHTCWPAVRKLGPIIPRINTEAIFHVPSNEEKSDEAASRHLYLLKTLSTILSFLKHPARIVCSPSAYFARIKECWQAVLTPMFQSQHCARRGIKMFVFITSTGHCILFELKLGQVF